MNHKILISICIMTTICVSIDFSHNNTQHRYSGVAVYLKSGRNNVFPLLTIAINILPACSSDKLLSKKSCPSKVRVDSTSDLDSFVEQTDQLLILSVPSPD